MDATTSRSPSRWLAPEHAVTLALLRVVVCAVVLASPEVLSARVLAARPAALRVAPEGLGWFVDHVPITPHVALGAQLGVALGAIAGLVGYRSRWAMGGVAVFGFYLFALSQLGGAVLHDMHLVWFAAVLAASPCGDALTLFGDDAELPARSLAYTRPLVVVRALLAAIYFFPGLWKLREAGLAWAWSDNLRNQMYEKWFEWGGWLPAFRVDEHPLLLRAGALGVIAFELSFPLLMLHRRARLVAALAGVAFHFGGAAFLRIHFPSLWLSYVALVDWGPLYDRLRGRAPAIVIASPRAGGALVALGALLVGGAVVQGARGAVFAWPFACYPTFQVPAGTTLPDLVLEADFGDGRVVTIDAGGHGRGRSQARWGEVWALAGATHGPPQRERLVADWNALDHRDAIGAPRGRAVRVLWSVLPEDRDRPPRARVVLATFPLDPQTGAAE